VITMDIRFLVGIFFLSIGSHTHVITYTWDANGNLLSGGVNTYTYDLANHLAAFSDGMNTTTYAVDIAGSLTRVLSEADPKGFPA
jgi:uncharacterized protein RhaS with RHS repeats